MAAHTLMTTRTKAPPGAYTPPTTGVFLPRLVRDTARGGSDLAVLVALYALEGAPSLGAAKLAEWAGSLSVDHTRRVLTRLEAHGWLTRSRTRWGTGSYRYTLSVKATAGGYDVIPHVMTRQLRDGEVSAADVRVYLVAQQAMGRLGWTRDTKAELAQAAGSPPRRWRGLRRVWRRWGTG